MEINVYSTPGEIADFVTNTWRPASFDKSGEHAFNARGELVANAFLNREEWEALDSTIIARAKQKLGIWGDVMGAGLKTTTTLAEWYSKWRVASERVAADLNMDFETQEDEDRTDRKTYGVPIPIISARFSIGRRELMTARATGASIETFEAAEAAAAVAEKAEIILVDGDTTQVVQSSTISGLRTLTARYTANADGDFGTLSNIYPSFRKAIAAMAALRYRGPFNVYMAVDQYHEMLEYYSDGTGQRALDRVLALPQISSVKDNDLMTAGQFIMLQMSKDVIDIREALPLETRRWESPSGSRLHFVVLMAAVPRLKTDYAGYAGIAHISGS